MSMLIHRCTCGHPDYFHAKREMGPNGTVQVYRDCANAGCRCAQAELDPEPEVVPNRMFGAGADDVLPLTKPGAKVNQGAWETCGCDACQAAYRAETEGVPA